MDKNDKRGIFVDYYDTYPSPLGTLLLESDGEALTGLHLNREFPSQVTHLPIFTQAASWLDDYFGGTIRQVDFPLAPSGTDFQRQVWQILREIPFGETRTYGSIAREMADLLGRENMSAQAVGGAVGKNPIGILIPCHRVVGAKGQLTGYAWGLEKKEWLLHHEGWL